jgi:hypothetical protein
LSALLNYGLNSRSVVRFYLLSVFFIFIFVFIFNPYTKVTALSYLLLPISIFSFVCRFKYIGFELVLFSILFVVISLVGVISSFHHGIGQFVHLKVSLSIFFYILILYPVSLYFYKRGFSFNDLVYFALLAVAFNSALILSEVLFPFVRDVVESTLAPSGNVDWSKGFRYRGLASGGGASLSVIVPVSIVLALHLYSDRYIGLIKLVFLSVILILSLFFIGRTGFLLLPVVLASYFLFNAKRHLVGILSVTLFLSLIILIFGGEVKDFLVEKYGIGFYNYSFGFFLSGVSGIKEEGTVSIILGFLTAMPKYFPEILFGYGFYGGSDFVPWTDSGYSRMFLSVGYFFGGLFYIGLILMSRNVVIFKPFLFLTILMVLMIAELKEPLLFSGYSARIYFSLVVFASVYQRFSNRRMYSAQLIDKC